METPSLVSSPHPNKLGLPEAQGLLGTPLGKWEVGGRATRRGRLQDARPSIDPGMQAGSWWLLLQAPGAQ